MAKKKEEIQEEPEKTVEELAREAMEAIEEAERAAKAKEEEEARIKEQAMKEEVEQKIRQKMRRLEREMKKEEENKPEEIDTSFMVHWSNPDKKGVRYEGNYNDKFTFRINRGLYLFHLYVEDKELINEKWHHNSHTSVNLHTLKEKADKLLKKFVDKNKNKEDENKV